MEFLTTLDINSYTTFILCWGCLGIVSALSIHLGKKLPISNRVDNSSLYGLGTIDKRWGWIIMETPILLSVLYFFFQGDQPLNISAVFVAVFALHYTNRALIYPHRIKVEGKRMAVSIVLVTMTFYSVNGYLIGHYFGSLQAYPLSWLSDPRFIVGMSLFLVGFAINIHSDNILINLRKPGESGYKIPSGGCFRLVSCPNYFGEILEWVGFAVMSWSLPGLVYALWVALTLLATGLSTHRWYLEHFQEEYPARRKAVLPYLW
ncbi:steroid 5-alpha-reductase/3-oxo-5-alpha-steroid 4-dehydrogenase 1 [Sinobacterium caligoides]|uniref:Steroid 5-alpha-reductase/3-oxo-5-alpha-steroid 4-dehydrogenase 1 n=1 Tax=Sinobacterium caligoides TaxID=933926 RepID=A0A3N2DZH2_9GAMM|nr:3-oxo-5-alpha-steroid 4-dehydrogenase [Sinobacterium caligoides]ROS04839.1 steroid 5-alpha-reductase/3-oxo-5-alpha-steroid 4-dehydrogenase 1 [Sinobacterium caligoides]